MNAIILASGKGTRMLPWTANKNKCMFKVNGKPLLIYHIENLIRIGVKKIFITVHWQCEEILKALVKFQFNKWGRLGTQSDLITIYQEKQLTGSGTATTEIIEKYNLKHVVIVYGDTFFSPSIYDEIDDYYKGKVNAIFIEETTNRNIGNICFDRWTQKITQINEDGFENGRGIDDERLGKNIGIIILKKIIIGTGDLMKNVLPEKCKNFYAIKSNMLWADIGLLKNYIQLIFKIYKNENVNNLIYTKLPIVVKFVKKILYADRIFICGNGGSLSTAEHLALDFSKVGGKNAIALNSAPVISAYGNDESFENIFIRQLRCFNIGEKDVIVLLSGSGNSKNIVNVAKLYPDNVIAMSGQSGYLIENVKLTLSAQSSNIRVIEDIHLAYGHAITEVMEGLA